MDIRERHLGRIAGKEPAKHELTVDIGALVRRLILFEHCTIESFRLKEIPALIASLGYKGLMALLESGKVDFVLGAATVTEVGSTPIFGVMSEGRDPLPPDAIALTDVHIPGDGRYAQGALEEVHKASIRTKDAKRLEKALSNRILSYPGSTGRSGIDETNEAVVNRHPWIWAAIRFTARREVDLDPGPHVAFEAEDLGGGGLRIATNLRGRGLSEDEERRIVTKAIMAAAEANQRIGLMRNFSAVTGFQAAEVQLFEERLAFLMGQLDPELQEGRFRRVVTIAGLPSLDHLPDSAAIDVNRLLKLCDSPECREFRVWLRRIDTETDAQIRARFESLRPRLAHAVRGPWGKVMRFLVTTGSGMIPPVGPIAGPVAGAADMFLLDKLVGSPGPVAFLSKHYPSLFK